MSIYISKSFICIFANKYAPITPPIIPGNTRLINSFLFTFFNLICEIPETNVVNNSEICTHALDITDDNTIST